MKAKGKRTRLLSRKRGGDLSGPVTSRGRQIGNAATNKALAAYKKTLLRRKLQLLHPRLTGLKSESKTNP
jgi:hypothetical protein|tara:strand:+ start:224 stop:433 length:210 start_codon:yes stop_codon:yes gene_type:complete